MNGEKKPRFGETGFFSPEAHKDTRVILDNNALNDTTCMGGLKKGVFPLSIE